MATTQTSAQLSFLEQAARRVDRDESSKDPTDTGDPTRTGVVFVHGIGAQAPGETLLQWSEPLIDLLMNWRVRNNLKPADPVVRAEVNFSDGIGAIEVRVPARPGSTTDRTWILTEAWWASRVSPPSLSTMANWLGPRGAAGRIVDAILANPSGTGPVTSGLIFAARAAVVPFVSVLAAVVLALYALFRGVSGLIPIQSVRDSAVLKSFDTFLTGWFGDVRVILFDPAQSANIRAGLARSIRGLREAGCSSIVVVAHSGGVMVSYLTLTDPALPDLKVQKLITFGNGWNLALQLSPANPPDGSGMADRLRQDITVSQTELRWRDFWATNDPAPAGSLRLAEIDGKPDTSRIRSGKVWNRRSLLGDHGTYWSNEEEFAIPVLQEIDVPRGWGEASMFFPPDPVAAPAVGPGVGSGGDSPLRSGPPPSAAPSPSTPAWPTSDGLTAGPRAVRHRQRVAGLAMLRQMMIAVPIFVIAVALTQRPDRLIDIGYAAAAFIGRIPGVSLLFGPIQWLNGLEKIQIRVGWDQLGFDLVSTLQYIGIATLQAVVIISIVQLLFSPVLGFRAWRRGSATWIVALLVEILLGVLLVVGLVSIIVGNHHQLLGSGADWAPGWALTAIVGGGAWILSKAVLLINSPAATRFFGGVVTVFFATTMLSAGIAIFGPDRLPDAEVAYVVIWAGAIILYRLAGSRWQNWDRLEQEIAKEPIADQAVNRWPAYLGAGGMVVLVAGASAAVLFKPSDLAQIHAGPSPVTDIPLAAVIAAAGLVLIILSYLKGAAASRNGRDPIAAPDPIESARR